MTLSKQERQDIISDFQIHEKDTGSPEVQVALLSERISYLTDHFQKHKQDHATRRGLMQLVGRRRKLLTYLKNKDVDRYKELIERLGLRG